MPLTDICRAFHLNVWPYGGLVGTGKGNDLSIVHKLSSFYPPHALACGSGTQIGYTEFFTQIASPFCLLTMLILQVFIVSWPILEPLPTWPTVVYIFCAPKGAYSPSSHRKKLYKRNVSLTIVTITINRVYYHYVYCGLGLLSLLALCLNMWTCYSINAHIYSQICCWLGHVS